MAAQHNSTLVHACMSHSEAQTHQQTRVPLVINLRKVRDVVRWPELLAGPVEEAGDITSHSQVWDLLDNPNGVCGQRAAARALHKVVVRHNILVVVGAWEGGERVSKKRQARKGTATCTQ